MGVAYMSIENYSGLNKSGNSGNTVEKQKLIYKIILNQNNLLEHFHIVASNCMVIVVKEKLISKQENN